MEVRFSVRDDGQVDVHLGPEWPIFNVALNDSISSLPPRGWTGNGPSTYWIDHAARGALDAQQRGDNRPFTRGNETLLCLRGDEVLANFDWVEPDEPGETMPLDDFFSLLAEWRSQVAQSASTATAPLPETYRRNPPSGPPGRRTRRGRSP
jgi:hypothetical protein